MLIFLKRTGDTQLLSGHEHLLNIILYAGLVPAVVYGYSYTFRRLTIIDSVVVGKSSDLFIPLALTFTIFVNTVLTTLKIANFQFQVGLISG